MRRSTRNLLPRLALIDVMPESFRWRLVGTELAAIAGVDFTGRMVDADTHPRRAAVLRDMLALAVRTRAPVSGQGEAAWPGRDWLKVEWVVCPMSRQGADPDILLAGFDTMRLGRQSHSGSFQFRPVQPSAPVGALGAALGRRSAACGPAA